MGPGAPGQDGTVPLDPSPELLEVLERARRLGVLGPGPVLDHVQHAEGFVEAVAPLPAESRVLDLGSGGGIPGLVVAEVRPDLRFCLIDALERRCALLVEAVARLGWAERVEVLEGRAELVGRGPMRGAADAVVARSFGPPSVVAECAAPLLRVGGLLVVSEPPDRPERWPADGIGRLGLVVLDTSPEGVRVLRQAEPCSEEFPRAVGRPAKRPLF